MKTSLKVLALGFLMLPLLTACGGGSDDDNDLVGTWVADRITGDQDSDADQATITYGADGRGVVYTNDGALNITWEIRDDILITRFPDQGFETETVFDLDDEGETGIFTTVINGREVTEDYHKVTDNHPDELVASWGCVSRTMGGMALSCQEVPALVLNADGTGSVLWNTTEGSFVFRNPATQLGGVEAYSFTSDDHLTLTEEDDTGVTVTEYQRLLL